MARGRPPHYPYFASFIDGYHRFLSESSWPKYIIPCRRAEHAQYRCQLGVARRWPRVGGAATLKQQGHAACCQGAAGGASRPHRTAPRAGGGRRREARGGEGKDKRALSSFSRCKGNRTYKGPQIHLTLPPLRPTHGLSRIYLTLVLPLRQPPPSHLPDEPGITRSQTTQEFPYYSTTRWIYFPVDTLIVT